MNEPFRLYVTNERMIGAADSVYPSADVYDFDFLELTALDGLMVQYTGLSHPAAVLYTAQIANMNGAMFQSSRLNTRNIVLTFTLLSNIEQNRRIIYRYFRTGGKVTLIYRGTRNAWIDGYVETMSLDQFKATPHKQVVQVSIVCPDPLLKCEESHNVHFDLPNDNDHFFNMNYGGDYAYGVKIKVNFRLNASVVNPYFYNEYDDPQTNGTLTINETFDSKDVLEICTIKGQKSVKKTRTDNGTTTVTDLMGKIDYPAKWLQLVPSFNKVHIGASADGYGIYGDITMTEVYGGI